MTTQQRNQKKIKTDYVNITIFLMTEIENVSRFSTFTYGVEWKDFYRNPRSAD